MSDATSSNAETMSRLQILGIWIFLVFLTPILLVAMFLQASFGSKTRAYSMAIALDECGNALLGGAPQQTVSRRTGLAFIEGKSWAKIAQPFIDAIFGKGHCADAAAGPAPVGDTEAGPAV